MKPRFTVSSVTITSSGTSVSDTLPVEPASGKYPVYVAVSATGAGAYVRFSAFASSAVNTDTLIQPGDTAVMCVYGMQNISALSVSGTSKINVAALPWALWKDVASTGAIEYILVAPGSYLLINAGGDKLKK
jgi:hypothetical protein